MSTPPLHLLVTICLIFCPSEAFFVTPWTRIGTSNRAPKTTASTRRRSLSSSISMVVSSESSSSSANNAPTLTSAQLEKAIVQLGRRGHTDQALDLYSSIDSPTVRQMNSAMDACSRARPTRLQECFRIFERGTSEHDLQPNVFTFGALVSACSRARRADRAIQVLKDMKVCTCKNMDVLCLSTIHNTHDTLTHFIFNLLYF